MSDNTQWRMPAHIQRSATEGDGDANRSSTLPARSQDALRSFSSRHGLGPVDSLRPQLRHAALNGSDRYYGPEQLPEISSNLRPPGFPLLPPIPPKPNHRTHVRSSTAGPTLEPSFRNFAHEHGSGETHEQLNFLGLQMQSMALSDDHNHPGQRPGISSTLRSNEHQPTFPNLNPMLPLRPITTVPDSAPSHPHSLADSPPFPDPVTFPTPMLSGISDDQPFVDPFSSTRGYSTPVNANGRSGGKSRQEFVDTHHNLADTHQATANTRRSHNNTHQMYTIPRQFNERRPPIPLVTSYPVPMSTGTQSEPTRYVCGAPMDRDHPVFVRESGHGMGQRQWNPDPNYARHQTVETYVPTPWQQTQQSAYGAQQMPTRGATADQGFRGEPGAYVSRSTFGQETRPLQSSPESLHYIEGVFDAASHYESDYTRDQGRTTGLVHESPQFIRNHLEVVEPAEADINEQVVDPSEGGKPCCLCPWLYSYVKLLRRTHIPHRCPSACPLKCGRFG